MRKNITSISRADMCSSCGACVAICKKNAIQFKTSTMGRQIAIVGKDCVNCGLCLEVCPSYKTDYAIDEYFCLNKLRIVVGRASNDEIFLNGQSGGAVTAILSFLFKTHKIDAALVCKNEKAAIITSELDLKSTQKSVYTPVSLLSEINRITSYKSVAVVGLPCHLAGLTNIMKYRKIPVSYKLGLICDRSLCGTIKDGILGYLKLQNERDVIIKWRNKEAGTGFGYKNAPITVEDSSEQKRILSSKIRQKLKLTFTSPRCLCCPDKLNLSADIVFGDPWNIDIHEENGASLILVNSYKGEDILDCAINEKDIWIYRNCSTEELNSSQHILERKEQVSLYSNILKKKNYISYLLNAKSIEHISYIEKIRARLNIYRFNFFEMLPKSIVKALIIWIIKNNDTENGE